MEMQLQVKDIEALENTSFAAAFPHAGTLPTEGIVCIDSVACVVSNDCSNGCIDTSDLSQMTAVLTSMDCGYTFLQCVHTINCGGEVAA